MLANQLNLISELHVSVRDTVLKTKTIKKGVWGLGGCCRDGLRVKRLGGSAVEMTQGSGDWGGRAVEMAQGSGDGGAGGVGEQGG